MDETINISNLTFGYRWRRKLFEDIDLSVPKGSVYGLLGSNGAGKTTLLRIILGLFPAKKGTVSVFGERPGPQNTKIYKRIGALVEQPQHYTHLSAYDNLKLTAVYHGISTKNIGEALHAVDLLDTGNKKVWHFSTGMKQRLAIAKALLPDPELLIFDEPVNGLDPQGIATFRKLIIELNQKKQKTIVLSSHLLGEVEQTCSHVSILYDKKMRFQGSMQQLRDEWLHDFNVLIDTGDNEKSAYILRKQYNVTEQNNQLKVALTDRDEIPLIVDIIREEGIPIYQVRREDNQLEAHFLKVLKDKK